MELKNDLNLIKVVLTHELACKPTKAYPDDIGYDLTAIGVYRKISDSITLFETGVKVCPPPGYYIEIVPRSSISKTGYMLANSVGTIDPPYRGTLKIALIKVDQKMPDITVPFTRCQMVLRRAEYSQLAVVDSLEKTERGSGGFGSTDGRQKSVVNIRRSYREQSHKVLHSFKNDNGDWLREIKHLNLPEDAPKNMVYQWEWIPNGWEPIPLTFVSSGENSRQFMNGFVIFDLNKAWFNFRNNVFKLFSV